jgi:asparagine synthetase B (glutamine-hydrolysing)
MFFGAYLGQQENLSAWQRTMRHHADWLQNHLTGRTWNLPNGCLFACGWLSMRAPHDTHDTHDANDSHDTARVRQENDSIVIDMRDESILSQDPRHPAHDLPPAYADVIELRVSLNTGELTVTVPELTPEQLHIAHESGSGWTVLSNDLRLMARWVGLDLDERAVLGFLQFGTLIPPFSLSKRISRIPSGHTLSISPELARPLLKRSRRSVIETSQQGHVVNPEDKVRLHIDNVLSRAPISSVLYFSGGVDSGLLAARLAAIGRNDVTLLHYSFGSNDPESELAAAMASVLGLRFEQITHDPGQLPLVLSRLAHDYSFPFDDYSAIPTNTMIHAMLRSHGAAQGVIEGSGADDAWAIGTRYGGWERIYTVPRFARRLLGNAHKQLHLWTHDSHLGRAGRVARRSAMLPMECAAIFARNSLNGIAYHTPKAVSQEIIGAIDTYYGRLTANLAHEDRFSILFVMHESCSLVAPKTFDPLRVNGVSPVYPFLDPALIHLSLSLTWDQKNEGGERKALLKKLLAQHVPPAMVYRRKAGFAPPFQALLALPSTQAYLHDIVLSEYNPLAAYFERRVFARMVEKARVEAPQSIEVHFFLWALMFLSGWLQQLQASGVGRDVLASSRPSVIR